jgi:hypothetical protein
MPEATEPVLATVVVGFSISDVVLRVQASATGRRSR